MLAPWPALGGGTSPPPARAAERSEQDEERAFSEGRALEVGGDDGDVEAVEVVCLVRGRGRLKVRRWVLTKSSPLLFHPFAALNAWADTEVSWGTTACLVTLTPVIVSVYGVELLPMLFPAAASTNRSKSASGDSPTSGWL